jgi:hypothetical protein
MGNGSSALARAENLDMATAGADANTDVQVVDASTLAALNKSEIDQQIATAHRYPRSIARFRDELVAMATIDQATADSCIYALPRGGKTIEGPSVRFAELVASCWGNLRWGGRVVEANEHYVVAQGFCHDLQSNSAIAIEVRRRVVTKKGKRADEDMIQLACAAATSIARRNALLATVPRALCQEAYEAADNCATTGKGSFEEHRELAVRAFEKFDVKAPKLYAALGVEGIADITGQQVRRLRRMFAALRDGAAVDEVLRPAAELEAESRARTSSTPSDLASAAGVIEPPQKTTDPPQKTTDPEADPRDADAP